MNGNELFMWRLKILIHDRRECMSRIEVKKARTPLSRREWLIISASFVISLLAGVLTEVHANAVLVFVVAAGALSLLAALVGSILGNSLFVLGLAFFVGGMRHGTQRFASGAPRTIAMLTLLAVAALVVPTLIHQLHTPAAGHEQGFSIASAVILLTVFVASIPGSLKGGTPGLSEEQAVSQHSWPIWLAIVLLLGAGVGAALVSNWFVTALTPAITFLHISPALTGFVIVALAGNAVENVVGVQFAARNQADFAISVILNSSRQVALGLTAILTTFITSDGESTWLEGLVLIGLYGIIAVSFWWG